MKYKELKEKIFFSIAENYEELVCHNDDLADHPEISGEEYRSSQKAVDLLKKHGYQVEYPFAGFPTSFRGVYSDGKSNKKYKVALMTEYDALPDIGHACGHCLSGSMSILAGLALKDLQDDLDTEVHILGTPIEETDGAKCAMVKDGVFDEYDMACMVHLYDRNLVYPTFLALSSFLYTFHGKAAHASSAPWEGRNAFNAAQLMFHAVDMMRQHCLPDTRIHGIIQHGGEAPNIVPEKVTAEFYARSLSYEYLMQLEQRIDNCAQAGCLATDTTWEKEPTAARYLNFIVNKSGTELMKEVFQELAIEPDPNHDIIFGSSDAGNVSFVCPTFHPCLQVVDRGVDIHTRTFAEAMKSERAHSVLEDGAKLLALHIAKVFSSKENIENLKRDFEAQVGSK